MDPFLCQVQVHLSRKIGAENSLREVGGFVKKNRAKLLRAPLLINKPLLARLWCFPLYVSIGLAYFYSMKRPKRCLLINKSKCLLIGWNVFKVSNKNVSEWFLYCRLQISSHLDLASWTGFPLYFQFQDQTPNKPSFHKYDIQCGLFYTDSVHIVHSFIFKRWFWEVFRGAGWVFVVQT